MASIPHDQAETDKLRAALGDGLMVAARLLRDLQRDQPADFVRLAEIAGVNRRRAFAMARIGRLFDQRGVPDSRLDQLGWAKLDIIAPHLSDSGDNLEDLLRQAETLRQHELKAYLRGEVFEPDTGTMILNLPSAQDSRLRSLLMQFGAMPSGNGLIHKEQALAAILDAIDALPEPLRPADQSKKAGNG